MKQARQILPTAALLSLVSAQSSIVGTPLGVMTSTYAICPTGTSTTILPGTTTVCLGGNCNGSDGNPIITAVPTPVTLTGTDGRQTIYNIDTTILHAPCPGGLCPATYTSQRECPCTDAPRVVIPDACPSGFITTEYKCHVCAANGGPLIATLTVPAPNGPYASQTPAMGPATNSPGPLTYSPAAPTAAVVINPSNPKTYPDIYPATPAQVAGAVGGGNAPAGSNGGANAASNAGSNAGSNGGANSGSNGGANVGANAGSTAIAAVSVANNNSPTSASNTTTGILPYRGEASKMGVGAMLVAGIVACMAFSL